MTHAVMDLENASDEELEAIIRRATNTKVDGSQFQRASIELDIRRKRRLFELQEKFYATVHVKADRIINLLELVSKKPVQSAVVAGLVAVLIGVAISILSALLQELLHLS